MATNEHNPDLSNLLTAISGSTINIVSEIDAAITDIQNYIDSTKTDIDNAITASQNNLYSHISGSTISIDNFIDAAITNINANVDSKTSLITTINNAFLDSGDTIVGVPNLNVGTSSIGKKCTSSGTEETLFYYYRPNYLFVQAWNDPYAASSAEVTIYYDAIHANNIIAHAIIPPGTSQIVACFPALANGSCYITAKADGTNPVCVAASTYTSTLATAVEITTGHSNAMKHADPTGLYTDPANLSILSYTSTQSLREFLWFDVSAIPSVATISEAYLELVKNDSKDTPDFHIGLADETTQWGEVCWRDRMSGVAWSVAGDGHGSMMPTPIFSGSIAGIQGDHLLFDITTQVKGWIDGSIPNNGLILYIYPNHPVAYGFAGITNPVNANRPRLKIYIS